MMGNWELGSKGCVSILGAAVRWPARIREAGGAKIKYYFSISEHGTEEILKANQGTSSTSSTSLRPRRYLTNHCEILF